MSKRKMARVNWRVLFGIVILAMAPLCAFGYGASPTPVAPVPNPCPRLTAGSIVHQPPDLFSEDGVLSVRFRRRGG